jgi:hypothetical protein
LSLVIGSTVVSNGTNGYILYNNNGFLGNFPVTGSGNVVMSASPTFTGTVTLPDGSTATSTGLANVLSETIVNGALTSSQNVFNVTATQPSSFSNGQVGVLFSITGNGSVAANNGAFQVNYNAGYTGPNQTSAGNFFNLTAGTGSTVIPAAGSLGTVGNFGSAGATNVTTSGFNNGANGRAGGGNINVGVLGLAQLAKNSAVNIGVGGSAINTGTSPVMVGGWFSLNQTTVPTVSAALIADNGSQSLPVALFQVNGSTTVEIDANGHFLIPGLPTGTAATYACFTAGGQLISSASAC